jgi:hypothetical protein
VKTLITRKEIKKSAKAGQYLNLLLNQNRNRSRPLSHSRNQLLSPHQSPHQNPGQGLMMVTMTIRKLARMAQ